MLRKAVNKIAEVIEAPSMDWVEYKRTMFSPTPLERQLGDWACGLFVMMALRCFAINGDYEKHCKNTLKDEMRKSVLETLLALLYV
jgi:hypothetical protein